MQPVRLGPQDDMAPVHALLHAAFAYMEARIDPPSSLHRMTPESLARDAATKELWVIRPGPAPLACVLLTPETDHLYLGKLAVAEAARGTGLSRQLMDHAVTRAAVLGLPRIVLQSRIELTENHAIFARMGFVETGRTAHDGYDRPTSLTFTRDLTATA
ncbi:GNAT family N-acetyltransferase [Pseudooceanicola nanhaiensis]|uniref:GNAT family N-acetyltransferase n=1 Tax=Pseudooceanicola nanhaiensis TaxID=375761 RepID=UPI001CD589F5|nr:GNAT family N-acetyltransferase [Pseudooceanicola nanhaiensis]MCA0920557.1 GNAT family N-acetyltransferase [Pseudooceanicola nanhaiensis]